jgi:hypothetical protein
MTSTSLHVAERIDRPADDVYAFVRDPANLPAWASGLGSAVELADGEWFVETPGGRVRVAFAPPNEYGVADHDVTWPDGRTDTNPMRVIRDGDGCEVVFTVRRFPGVTDEEFARDAGLVAADLATLRRIMEA